MEKFRNVPSRQPTRTSHRPERMADLIREEVAQFMMTGLKDPRVGFVTITQVKVTKDLRLARVYYSVFGSEKEKAETAEGLSESVGRVRSHLAKNVRARYVPHIEFFVDEGLERSLKIQTLLNEIKSQ